LGRVLRWNDESFLVVNLDYTLGDIWADRGAEIHQQLARALAQQGKKEETVEHYQEALRLVKAGRKG
jgi:tetratricopeptide (TPR) repeat protein